MNTRFTANGPTHHSVPPARRRRPRVSLKRRFLALLLGRCPRCLRGPIFRGQFAMHERCPDCGLQFGREEGYFTGAMIFSYVLAVPVLAVLYLGIWLVTRWDVEPLLVASTVALGLFVPAIFRYSRIIWIHLDRLIDPDE